MSALRRPKPRLEGAQPELARMQRRLLLRGGLSLGALGLLSGCDLSDNDVFDRILAAMSRWNDRVQAALFSEAKLAPTYPASAITKPFPFNGYYSEDQAPSVDAAAWRLQLSGSIADKRPWTLAQLRTLPQESQITRLICVEGWSVIGQWSGVPFHLFLKRIGADTKARYVGFRCFDKYYSSIDMASALHPQTLLALDFAGQPLPREYGAPLRLRLPTKLGFKNPKYIAEIFVTNTYPGGYWEDQGYNWFSGS